MIVAAAVLRWWLAAEGTCATPIFVSTWTRVDTFAAGAWIAIAIRTPAVRTHLERFGLGALLVTGAGVMLLGYGSKGLHWSKWGPLETGVVYGLIAMFFAMLIAILLVPSEQPTRLQRIFSSRVLGRIGVYSYAIYLFHLPLETLARGLELHPGTYSPVWGSVIPVTLVYIVGNTLVALGIG